MNDDRLLSQLYRLGTRPARDRRDSCLTPEEILAALDGEASGRERAAEHAGRCSACAEDLRLALGLDALGDRPTGAAGEARWLRVAAAVVLGAGLALLAVRLPRGETEETTGLRGEAESAWASTTPPDGARLADAPTRFAWPARPGATGYVVALFDEESTLIWESPRTAAPRADLPPEVAARLKGGGTFYWRVTVWSPAGRSTSPLAHFEVRP